MNQQQAIFDFIRDSNKALSDIREDIGVLKAHAEQQVMLGERVDAHDARLGMVESDVKVAKRIFTSLFGLLSAGVAAIATWLK